MAQSLVTEKGRLRRHYDAQLCDEFIFRTGGLGMPPAAATITLRASAGFRRSIDAAIRERCSGRRSLAEVVLERPDSGFCPSFGLWGSIWLMAPGQPRNRTQAAPLLHRALGGMFLVFVGQMS